MLADHRLPPLTLILGLFALVTFLEIPMGILIDRISPILGVFLNETVIIGLLPIAGIELAGYSIAPLLRFERPSRRTLLVALCITIGAGVLLTYGQRLSHELIPIPEFIVRRHHDIVRVAFWEELYVKLAILGLIAPVCEEVLFRGFLQTSLARHTTKTTAILITAVLFTLAHSTTFQPHLYLILGLMLSWIYAMTGSLRIVIACHALHNIWTLINQVRGWRLPLMDPIGRVDLLLIGSSAMIVIAGMLWLWRKQKMGKTEKT